MSGPSWRSFSELLPWMFTFGQDDVVVNKDGSLSAVFELNGIDVDGAVSAEVSYCLQALDNAYELFKDSPCIFTWLVHRRRVTYYPEGRFPDPWSARIDEERRRQFASGRHYINRHYLAVTLVADKGLGNVSSRMALYLGQGLDVLPALLRTGLSYLRGSDAFVYSAQELTARTDVFQTLLTRFVERLAGIGLYRVTGDALRGFLRRCVNPQSSQEELVAMPFLDTHVPDAELMVETDRLRFGESCVVTGMSLKEPPRVTRQGLFELMLALDGELVFSQNFRFAAKKEIMQYLVSVRQYNDLLKYSPMTWVYLAMNKDADARANDARLEAAESAHVESNRVEMNNAYYGWYGAQVMAIGQTETEAERVLAAVAGALEVNNFTTIRERLHLLSAFSGGIPGMVSMQKRWFMLELASLSDLSPIRTIDPGRLVNGYLSEQRGVETPALMLFDTEYNTPYYFNLHVGDLGHALVVGPSRSGKSTGMNILIAQFRKYQPCRIIIFDKDRSCRIATLMMGGEHIDIADRTRSRWNPLSLLGDTSALEWLASWIEGIISYRGYRYGADDVKDVWRALQGLAAQDAAHWTLGHLHAILSPALQNELDAWVGNGALAHYFDNREDTFSISDFSCIEMGEILQKQHVARAFMDYAFFRIYKLLRDNSRGVVPTLIYIEECWFMLENPYFEQKIRDWTKTFAKLVAQLVMATQSLEDIAESRVFSSLRDNIQTRIYLPNSNAASPLMLPLYTEQFGLHADQVAQIANGTPKQDYFIQQPDIFRRAIMRIDPLSLAVVRSDSLAQAVFQRHYTSGAENWRENYVQELLRPH